MEINEIVEVLQDLLNDLEVKLSFQDRGAISSAISILKHGFKEKVSVEVIAKCIYDYGIKMNAEGYESNIELTILENAKDLAQEIHKLITKELTGEG
jgi:hypothetical protein